MDGVSTNVPCTNRKCKRLLTPLHFEQFLCEVSQGHRYVSSLPSEYVAPNPAKELDEACRLIANVENIIYIVLRQELKFFDGLLTLRDRFLGANITLWFAKGMKLASEEMLLKVGEMYVDLSIHYKDIVANIVVLEH
ncbi:unnamed protein product [Lactuca saligna]|uniref:Uncharacterized protein n=1 Tax=Lactuca saligna TaxID=75948 RepID=A0AA35VGW4_LACSI|nr:unnamed protein product [Lactuca saligna]